MFTPFRSLTVLEEGDAGTIEQTALKTRHLVEGKRSKTNPFTAFFSCLNTNPLNAVITFFVASEPFPAFPP